MSSEKQILANRRNAQKSTGPKTDGGKAASRNNVFKHGLLSKDIIIPGEDAEKFDYIKNQLEAELEPVGFQEAEIVERMAISMWRLRRLYKVEAEIFSHDLATKERDRALKERQQFEYKYHSTLNDSDDEPATEEADDDQERQDTAKVEYAKLWEREVTAKEHLAELSASIGIAFVRDARGANAFTKLSRYETTMERSLSRLRMDLERLQRTREEKSGAPPVTIEHVNESDC